MGPEMFKDISVLAVPPRLRGIIADRRAAGRRRRVSREVRMPAGFTDAGLGRLRTLSVHTPDLSEGGSRKVRAPTV